MPRWDRIIGWLIITPSVGEGVLIIIYILTIYMCLCMHMYNMCLNMCMCMHMYM